MTLYQKLTHMQKGDQEAAPGYRFGRKSGDDYTPSHLLRLPKTLSQDVFLRDRTEALQKEIAFCKRTPADYFKLRVRDFQEVRTTSFDDVLVNRTNEIIRIRLKKEEMDIKEARLKIHYWPRANLEELLGNSGD